MARSKTNAKASRKNGQGGSSRRASYTAVPASDTEANNHHRPKRQASRMASSVNRKPSPVLATLPTLTTEEFAFFETVDAGDIDGVMKFDMSSMNINKCNISGYTVLQIAVRRQDENMVEYLLAQPNILLNDSILHAVREDNADITKLLLEFDDKLAEEDENPPSTACTRPNSAGTVKTKSKSKRTMGGTAPLEKSGIISSIRPMSAQRKPASAPKGGRGSNETARGSITSQQSINPLAENEEDEDVFFDSEFHEVVTPLMVAAQVGSTDLMELFYERGERLETPEYPHNGSCGCDICSKLEGEQDMTRAYQREQLFKAVTTPAYICFMALKLKIDPVNYAIDKIIQLRQLQDADQAFYSVYASMIEELEKFICKMISLCRTTLETQIFLSVKDTEEKERLPHQYPRLWYAVGLKLKKFVAHSHTQNIVYKLWATDDWPDWDSYGTLYRMFNLAIRIIGFPIIALILFFGQETSIGKTLGSPISRFLTYVASYLFFIGLVIVQVAFPYQRCNDDEHYYEVHDQFCKQKGPPNIGTEWPIVIYILSFCASTLKRHSVAWFWDMKWNWYDVVCWMWFIACFICWVWAWVWTQVLENEDFIFSTERVMWEHDSPEILSECFLAVATIFACGRLFRFIQIFPEIGPMQVALGMQIRDFVGLSLAFFVVLFSFGSGLLAIYAPYKDYSGLDEHNDTDDQNGDFTEAEEVFKHFFWHLHGQADGSPATLLTWETKVNDTYSHRIHHDYNQYTGKILYVGFQIIGSLMMWNVMQGYFGGTMSAVLDEKDTVWKYCRTELYLTHVKDTVLPPPFNLIPTIATIGQAMKYVTLLGKTDDPKAGCSFRQCCFVTETRKTKKWKRLQEQYRKLIVQLIHRYFNAAVEDGAEEEATRDDVKEIGEELAELKSLLSSITDKGGDDNGGGGSSSDDSPPGGGGGTSSDGKKRWNKPKHIVETKSSRYLQNKMSQGGHKGGQGGNRGDQGGAGGGGATTATSTASVRQQPKQGPSNAGQTTHARNHTLPSGGSPVNNFKMQGDMGFMPSQHHPGFKDFSGISGSPSGAQLPVSTSSRPQNIARYAPAVSTQGGGSNAYQNDFHMTTPKSTGLRDFTGMSPPPTRRDPPPPQSPAPTNMYQNDFHMATPKQAGMRDFTGISPSPVRPSATSLPTPHRGQFQTEAPMTSTPVRSGVPNFTGASPPLPPPMAQSTPPFSRHTDYFMDERINPDLVRGDSMFDSPSSGAGFGVKRLPGAVSKTNADKNANLFLDTPKRPGGGGHMSRLTFDSSSSGSPMTSRSPTRISPRASPSALTPLNRGMHLRDDMAAN